MAGILSASEVGREVVKALLPVASVLAGFGAVLSACAAGGARQVKPGRDDRRQRARDEQAPRSKGIVRAVRVSPTFDLCFCGACAHRAPARRERLSEDLHRARRCRAADRAREPLRPVAARLPLARPPALPRRPRDHLAPLTFERRRGLGARSCRRGSAVDQGDAQRFAERDRLDRATQGSGGGAARAQREQDGIDRGKQPTDVR